MYTGDSYCHQFNTCYVFDTAEERNGWMKEVRSIREEALYYWGRGPSGVGGTHPLDRTTNFLWLRRVEILRNTCGVDKVPPDIKNLAHAVEGIFEIPEDNKVFPRYTKEERDSEIELLQERLEEWQAQGHTAAAAPMPQIRARQHQQDGTELVCTWRIYPQS